MNETIYYGAIISALTILVNLFISIHTINTNRKLNDENTKINAENAGKNRVIYEIDQIDTSNAYSGDLDHSFRLTLSSHSARL